MFKLTYAGVAAAGALIGLVAGAFPAEAHHAFAAEFDSEAPVLLRGKVTKVEWVNPHTWIHINVVAPGKPDQEWMIEGGTPNTLVRAGATKESLPVGTEIVVRGYQSKDRRCLPVCKANGGDLVFPDGKKIFIGSSGTGAPYDADKK